MSYNLGVNWLSGCSEVGDHDVYSICYILRKNTNNQTNSLWQNKCKKKQSSQFYISFAIFLWAEAQGSSFLEKFLWGFPFFIPSRFC